MKEAIKSFYEMKQFLQQLTTSIFTIFILCSASLQKDKKGKTFLIAHRGGVVDSLTPENSREALLKAVEFGYWMVELDVRVSKDSILIAHHDRNFNRYFSVCKRVGEMTWNEIIALNSEQNTKVQKLEDAFRLCAEHNINVMIDTKVEGYNPVVFQQLIDLLDKYKLREYALMIGTEESTAFFTGKVRLSCTKKQLLRNMKRADYASENYFYFGNPNAEDARWAKDNGIMVVGVINEWALPKTKEMKRAKEIATQLKTLAVSYVQIDSKYDTLFQD